MVEILKNLINILKWVVVVSMDAHKSMKANFRILYYMILKLRGTWVYARAFLDGPRPLIVRKRQIGDLAPLAGARSPIWRKNKVLLKRLKIA